MTRIFAVILLVAALSACAAQKALFQSAAQIGSPNH